MFRTLSIARDRACVFQFDYVHFATDLRVVSSQQFDQSDLGAILRQLVVGVLLRG